MRSLIKLSKMNINETNSLTVETAENEEVVLRTKMMEMFYSHAVTSSGWKM